ncbi:MAG: leucine-rich repeat domain-containing protein [Pseudomonadota bacterium]|nr:leucine-rich repeat domain-containing protein [Pseudomonadota bacterium]
MTELTQRQIQDLLESSSDPTTLVVPDGITKIPDYACSGIKSLKQVMLPDSCVMIGKGAFMDCEQLTTCHLPDSLEFIGDKAFAGNYRWVLDRLPTNLRFLGLLAFEGIKLGPLLALPLGLHKLSPMCFAHCTAAEDTCLIIIPQAHFTINTDDDWFHLSKATIACISEYPHTGLISRMTVRQPSIDSFNIYDILSSPDAIQDLQLASEHIRSDDDTALSDYVYQAREIEHQIELRPKVIQGMDAWMKDILYRNRVLYTPHQSVEVTDSEMALIKNIDPEVKLRFIQSAGLYSRIDLYSSVRLHQIFSTLDDQFLSLLNINLKRIFNHQDINNAVMQMLDSHDKINLSRSSKHTTTLYEAVKQHTIQAAEHHQNVSTHEVDSDDPLEHQDSTMPPKPNT